jgi:hypothetical protein
MSDRIKDLLHEVADGVEPGDRLDAIRTETSGGRRTGRGWWAAGGVGLIAASVVTALALSTGSTPQSTEPPPAEQSTPSPTADGTGSLQERKERLEEMRRAAEAEDGESAAVAVYYVGDTPDGPRLYREFRRLEGEPLVAAVSAAAGHTVDGPPLAPVDPDYRVPWPAMTRASASLSAEDDVIEVALGGDPQDDLHDRGTLSEAEAAVAVEALVRTAQGAIGERLPVRFLLFGEITDQVLGVPTSEPLAAESDLAVLAHVSLSDPSEGLLVDNDEPFTVTGVGNSFEGNIVTRIQRLSGVVEIVAEEPAIAGTYEDRLFPFEVTFDLTAVPPGDYLVVSRTDDPTGEGRVHVDDRRITIVD